MFLDVWHHRDPRRAEQGGYTYLGLLTLVAVVALVTAGTLKVGMTVQRSAAEDQLLQEGLNFAHALQSFQQKTPTGQHFYPRRIEDLLRDPRHTLAVVRHLRTIPVDPITGQATWGEVRTPDGQGITGFHSLSHDTPWRTLFKAPFQDFADLPTLADWVFTADLEG